MMKGGGFRDIGGRDRGRSDVEAKGFEVRERETDGGNSGR
jgi:hypothetical protein